jgi:hypothetical protein
MLLKILQFILLISLAFSVKLTKEKWAANNCDQKGNIVSCFQHDCSLNNNMCQLDSNTQYSGILQCSHSKKICLVKDGQLCNGDQKNCVSGFCGGNGRCRQNN